MATKHHSPLTALLARVLSSLLLVFSTYNPTGYSYYHLVMDGANAPLALKILAGTALVILYAVVLSVMTAAFGRLIVGGLAAALLGTTAAMILFSDNWIILGQYGVLTSIALVIALGMSWSRLIEKLTGQQQKRYVR
jgi:hypothetical protein